ncbi:MAG: hypothetical protein KDD40_02400 [Bdellovibrionales bacterium]|nr:hypothetical protein [Bdellovibrionales bacterium]
MSIICKNCDNYSVSAQELQKRVNYIKPYFIHFSTPLKIVISLADGVLEGVDRTGYMNFDPKWLNTDPNVDPVFFHEYAHLVFGHLSNLLTVIPENNYFIDIINQEIKVRKAMEATPLKNIAEHKRLKKEARFLKYESEEDPLATVSRPYNELFADLVACLATKNPNAMAEVEKDSLRSFVPGIPYPEHYEKQRDEHVHFFKTRQFIWQKYIDGGMTLTSAQNILRITYQAAWKEIKLRVNKERLQNLSLIEIDQRFYSALNIAL